MSKHVQLPNGQNIEERRNGNGSSKIIWTTMVGAVGIIVTFSFLYVQHVEAGFNNLHITDETTISRVTRLEEQYSAILDRLNRIDSRLENMEKQARWRR